MGEMVTFKANGRTANGYLAKPASGKGPGIIVVQEWWGLVPHIEDIADRFAKEGFFALAPDLYHGEKAKSPNDADKLMMALNMGEVAKDMRGAADYLVSLDGVQPEKVATLGFCMGGQLALFAASQYPEHIGAAVNFYGVHPAAKPNVAQLSGPVLQHFGLHDSTTPPDAARALTEQIRAAGKTVDSYFYDAGHAFFNDQRPQVYNAEASKLAWDRTLSFLHSALA